MCIMHIFNSVSTVGTWHVQLILGGLCMCGGVAKGSGNVEFFQHNHMNPPTTLLCPWAVSPCGQGAPTLGIIGAGWVWKPVALSRWILEDSEVSRGFSVLGPLCLGRGGAALSALQVLQGIY